MRQSLPLTPAPTDSISVFRQLLATAEMAANSGNALATQNTELRSDISRLEHCLDQQSQQLQGKDAEIQLLREQLLQLQRERKKDAQHHEDELGKKNQYIKKIESRNRQLEDGLKQLMSTH